nr:LOW QUALITY PROTEIN: epidermal growth factor receptor substrate 15-like 1 [Danaus plexippus plexippus]
MAALPSPTQVAGAHSSIYEAYYHQVDPNGSGAIQALDAARFLKKSRLSDVVLSKIWDLSDPTGKGYLDKAGLFVALKLVSLAQAGKEINMSNIHSEAPPPKVGELPKVPPPSLPPAAPPALAPLGDWSVKPAERDKYSALFDSLQPNNGVIPGNKVKGVLMESKLPLETLGKIWDLADQDKDGMLDRHEFIVAMHLVYKALEKHAVPTTLPPELRARPARPPSRPPSRPQTRPPPPRPQPPPQQSNATLLEGLLDLSSPPSAPPAAGQASGPWMTAAERSQYDAQFEAADLDRDGFVSGAEIRGVFLDSGLPQMTLAQIWSLCDQSGSGKLSVVQFRAAMCLVQRALRGHPPPAALPPHLMEEHSLPPAQKPEPVSLGPQPTPEMDAIAREVDALARERLALEAELTNKQREVAVKTGEADSLQSELDTLTATLKQLENQKGEAQKRLNDLKSQVDKLRSQVSAQEAAAVETEAEVSARRAALLGRQQHEQRLKDELEHENQRVEQLTGQLSASVLAVSQARIKLEHLEQQHSALEAALQALDAGSGDLALQPLHRHEHLERLVRGCTPSDALEEDGEGRGESGGSGGMMNGSFAKFEDSFTHNGDPFAPSDSRNTKSFASFSPGADPFSGDSFVQSEAPAANDSAWESDPFAVLHAPTRATANASSTPAAAKSHKTPPPRPAPPRPLPPHKRKHARACPHIAALNGRGGLGSSASSPRRSPPHPIPSLTPPTPPRPHTHSLCSLRTTANPPDFTEDPFKDYRYEDPFNIDDPFADIADPKKEPRARPASAAAFPAAFPAAVNGRVSAPPLPYDPFASRDRTDSWAVWPEDDWTPRAGDSQGKDDWAADWDHNANPSTTHRPNDTWPTTTLPAKKEKSPKPVKYARSLVHTIGGIGRSRHKDKKGKETKEVKEVKDTGDLSEEQQWAWAEAESRRLQREADERRRREERELQLALALSRTEQ